MGFTGLLLLVAGFASLVYYLALSQHRLIAQSARSDYMDITRSLGVLVTEHVASGDRERIAELVTMTAEASRENIRYIAVEDVWGKSYASSGSPPVPSGPVLEERVVKAVRPGVPLFGSEDHVFELGVPVVRDGVRYGSVRMGVSTRGMNVGVYELLRSATGPILLGLLLFAALALLVDVRLRRIFSRFIGATRRMAEGDLESPVEIHTGDDLEELARNFNLMADAVRERDRALRRVKESLEETVRERTRELSAEKERLDAIVGAVGAGMLLLDPELRVIWANRLAQEWLGGRRPLVGEKCPWAAARGEGHCYSCPSRVATTRGRTDVADAVPIEIDGVQRYFTVISSPVVGPDGKVSEVLELLLDVTRHKKVEADLVQAAKLASVGELAGGVAHEIGNPVAVISAKAKLLLAELRAGRQPRHLARDLAAIERHAERIGSISGNLLSYARRPPGERTAVRIADAIGEALALVEHRLVAGRVRSVVDVRDDLPAVTASRNELVQVFVNLLQNAIDAMPRGGEVRIEAGERDGALHVLVSDTGTGMTKAVTERLFQPFFTTKEPGRGTGLGLSISQSIIGDHGGSLAVESRPGEGSTFAIRLPVQPAETHA